MNEVEQFYDQYDEWERFERHKIEFEITKRYLREYLTGRGLNILDIGGGPGRYSFELAAQGHSVTLIDLSSRNVQTAKRKSAELGLRLQNILHGDALRLDEFVGVTLYDAVLLMGPLYHLADAEDRREAVRLALRHLKPNGIFAASFISVYAVVQDTLAKLLELTEVDDPLHYLSDGVNRPGDGFTTAYFYRPQEAQDFLSEFPLTPLAFAGIENILGSREQDLLRLPPEQFTKWLDIGYRLSRDPNLMGSSMHYLYLGQKKDAD